MKLIKNTAPTAYRPTCIEPDRTYCVIDIETRGLGYRHDIILIGLVFFSSRQSECDVLQLFNDDGLSERELLYTLLELLKSRPVDAFISFNGDAFDFSFINARLKHHRFSTTLSKAFDIDLLKIVRQNKNRFNLDAYTLKNIERFFNIDRVDTISGKESVELYEAYLAHPTPACEAIICRHNYDDIVNLLPLYDRIVNFVDMKPLPVVDIADNKWAISNYYIKNHHLTIHFSTVFFPENTSVDIVKIGYRLQKKEHFYELSLLLKGFGNNTLWTVDTDSVYGIPFQELSNEAKQRHILYNEGVFYESNIYSHLETLLKTYPELALF